MKNNLAESMDNPMRFTLTIGIRQDVEALKEALNGEIPPSYKEITPYSRSVFWAIVNGKKKFIDKIDIEALQDDFSRLRDNPNRDSELTQKAGYLVTRLAGFNSLLQSTGQKRISIQD